MAKSDFFKNSTEIVARDLIGMDFVRYFSDSEDPFVAKIIAVGAFRGTSKKFSNKGQPGMYYGPGVLYVMKLMGSESFVIGTESEQLPSVVSIMGIALTSDSGVETVVGQGRVAKRLGITSSLDNRSIDDLANFSFKGYSAPQEKVLIVPHNTRIGIGSGRNYLNQADNCFALYAHADFVNRS